MIKFTFTDNYNEEFNGYINDLYTKTKAGEFGLGDRQVRISAVDDLINSFVEFTGKIPKPTQLDRLSSLILREELTDPTPWKTRNTEYPIHSERQEKGINDNEVGLLAAENYDTSGKNQNYPKRRKRSKAENAYMDRKS